MRRRRRFPTRTTAVALAVLVLLALYVLVWPVVSPNGPNEIDFERSREGPSFEHPLGTDQLGRDLLARVAVGGRNTLMIASLALMVIVTFGFLYGSLAALAGGWLDAVLMRIVDGLFAIPRLIIAIAIVVGLRVEASSVPVLVLALSVTGWLLTARLIRGHVLTLKSRDFVRAARAVGAGWPRVVSRHVLPNSVGVAIAAAFLELPTIVLGEAFLAVFGFGPAPPAATWGNIAYLGLAYSRTWDMFIASAAIMIFAVAATIVAHALPDRLDPRRRVAA